MNSQEGEVRRVVTGFGFSRKWTLALFALVWPAFAAAGAAQNSSQTAPSAQTGDGGAASRGSGQPTSRINESLLVGLPLNGRSYSQLATLEAGVSDPSSVSSSRGTGGGSLNVSGGRASSNSFLLDGTNIMDTGNSSARSAAGVQLGSDAVLQVLVFSTTYSAEYGRGSGGVLNSITRSGGTDWHGTLFEYLRNSKLDARNWVERGPEPVEPAPFKRNQFGFTVSGPIRRDKTYLMGSFEALVDRLNETQLDTFIDAFAKRGIIADKDGNPRPSGPGSLAEPIAVSPRVKPYLDIMPDPNAELLGGGLAHNVASQFLPTDEKYFTIRLDHAFTPRTSLFGRYSFDDATSDRGGGIYVFGTRVTSRQQYATLVASHIFNTRLLSSFRLGYTRPVDLTDSISEIDIPRSLYFVENAPQFGIINVPGMVGFGPASTTPELNRMNSFQFSGDLVAQRGDHGLKLGAEVHRYRWDVFSNRDKAGTWSFNGLESFLQGGPAGTSLTAALPGSDNTKGWRQTLLGLYVQDEYQVRPSLQLSLGLRYEYTTLVHDEYGRTSYLDDVVRGTQMTPGPLLDHNPSGNFSPRMGISWAPGGSRSTFINAGFGIYYDQFLGYALDTQKNAAPYYRQGAVPNFNSSCNGAPDATCTFPDALAALQYQGTFPQHGQAIDYHDFTNTQVLRYEFGIQRSLPLQTNLRISYVGTRGNHLWRNYEANLYTSPVYLPDGTYYFPAGLERINPAFQSGINVMASDAQSFYNALFLAADTRLSRTLSVRGSYTFSRSIDDASAIGTSASAQQFGLDRTLDRGLSNFHIKHRVSSSFFYTLPGTGWNSGMAGVVSQVIGGWRIGGLFSFRTSTPTTARITVRRPGYLFSASRPDLLAGQSNNPTSGTSIGCQNPDGTTFIAAGTRIEGPELFYDPCVFRVPEAGRVGTLGRNTILGPSLVNLDVSLQRDFPLGGDRRLQFRAEMFNVANHTNFRTPTANSMQVFTGGGRYNSGAALYVNTSTTSRQLQFALRLSF